MSNRLRTLLASILVGTAVGALGLLFLAACHAVGFAFLDWGAGYRAPGPAGEPPPAWLPHIENSLRPWVIIAAPAIGGLLAGWLIARLAPDAAGAGTNAYVAAYHAPQGAVAGRTAAVKLVASALSIGSGGSGGREGPMIQIGAGVGSRLARMFRLSSAEGRVLMAAGVAAGIAAVFRAPFAGMLFAAEVLYRSGELEPEVLTPAATAAVAGYAVAAPWFRFRPLFAATPAGFGGIHVLPACALLALCMVALAWIYVRSFHIATSRFRALTLPPALRTALGGLLTGLVAAGLLLITGDQRVLAVLGFGLSAFQDALIRPEQIGVGLLLLLALGKIATTCLSIGSGGSGGVFGPALIIGGCGGAAFGMCMHAIAPATTPPATACSILGVIGFFTAAGNIPISTLVIACEMTGDFGLLPAGLWVSAWAFALSGKWTLFPAQPHNRSQSAIHRRETEST